MSQAFPPLGPEYEPFLYAVVCDDPSGAPLTVVSAIARSGADPWREAARIARLPKSAAFEALACLIPVSSAAENEAIAQRLFSLLPPPRQNMNFRFADSPASAFRPGLSPLVLIVIVLFLGVALVSVFRTTRQASGEPHELPAAAPVADRAGPGPQQSQ